VILPECHSIEADISKQKCLTTSSARKYDYAALILKARFLAVMLSQARKLRQFGHYQVGHHKKIHIISVKQRSQEALF
jgi:hypothetical protein